MQPAAFVERDASWSTAASETYPICKKTASTARVLNLLAIWQQNKDSANYIQKPFFQNPKLNRAVLLKHRLRADEAQAFGGRRLVATKIIFPIDPADLKLGASSVFIGERNHTTLIQNLIGRDRKSEAADFPLLEILDRLPSFDPFLLREEMARCGYKPASAYFRISESDLEKIFSFVEREIGPLVTMALGPKGAGKQGRLVQKLLSDSLDAEMQPLRMVLRLDENEFAEGVFWWKGFLYYQWMYGAISAQTKATIAKVAQVRTADKMEADVRTELDRVRRFLVEQIVSSTERIKAMLEVYTQAYAKLTKTGEPVAFRDFLLKSPEHFVELGGRIGVLDHIKSFCDFRFPDGEIVKISAPELLDVFHEFEGHFGVQQKEYAPAKLAS